MASAFWYLEDGRGFARRWSAMFYMLDLINNEVKLIEGGEQFSEYYSIMFWMRKLTNIMVTAVLSEKALMKILW